MRWLGAPFNAAQKGRSAPPGIDEQHGIVEERRVVPDVIGHDRADLVRPGRKLLRDRTHQA
jgi:hypothetical protein